jgi:hypothetical protein
MSVNFKIQSRLEIICKFLVAVGIVLLLLGLIQLSGLPTILKMIISIIIGMLFIAIGNFVERRCNPKWRRLFSFLDNGTAYCRHNETANKQTNGRRPAPPIPYEKANYHHQNSNETQYIAASPLKNPTDKIHNFPLLWGLFYRLIRRLSTKMQKNLG